MSLFKKFVGKSKKDKAKADRGVVKKPKPEGEETGTVLRQPKKATPITKEKERVEHTALEIAEQQDWEVKTLPVWQPGDLILDTYEVEDVLSGGMGHVYIANHNKWNVKLAIKSPNEMMLSNRSNFARILREANSWTELGLHPNIAYCYYIRNIEDVPHIFVEYVDGGNLRQWIEEGKCIDYRTSLDLAIQFCHGMEHAHSKGMIHRDIKPENILMTKDAVLKITDFGLVRGGDGLQGEDQSLQNASQEKDSSLTVVGAEMGTWGYMSPEQKENPHEVDERTDIFAFGIFLYEMFCGNRPYEITFGPRQEPPDPKTLSSDESFPLELAEVLRKCVQWDPADRYTKFIEIRAELSLIYIDLYGEDSPYAKLKLVTPEADSLNNQGISYFDLGKKDYAINCWQQALKEEGTHLETTYNLSLIQWRAGEIDDLEALRRLENCSSNPIVDKEALSEFSAYIHAERLDPDSAKEVLKGLPGRYEFLFSGTDLRQIKLIRVIKGQPYYVYSMATFRDGRLALVSRRAGWDRQDYGIELWDVEENKCLRVFKGHTDRINSVAVLGGGRLALSGSADKTLKLWEIETEKCIHSLTGHSEGVKALAVFNDDRFALSGSEDKTIKLWDLTKGKCVRSLTGHASSVECLAVFGDGRLALSGSWDKMINLWDLETNQCIRTFKGHNDGINSLIIVENHMLFLSGSSDCDVRMWEIETGQCIRTLKGHTDVVNSVTVSADHRFALSGSADKTIKLWEINTGRCIRTLNWGVATINSVSFIGGGEMVLVGGDNGLRLFGISGYEASQSALQLSRPKAFENRKAEQDARMHEILQAEACYQKGDYKQAHALLYQAWKDTGFRDDNFIIRIYADLLKRGKIKDLVFHSQQIMLKGHTNSIRTVDVFGKGKLALSGSADKTLKIWDLETGRCIRTLKGHTDLVSAVMVTGNDRLAISASRDKSLRLWDLETGRSIRTFEGHTGSVSSLAVTSDGRLALSGSADKTLKIWEIETGKSIRTLKGHTDSISSVAISRDGKLAISGNADFLGKNSLLMRWDLETGKSIHALEGHSGWVNSIAIFDDGRFALSGSADNTVRLWDLDISQCIRIFEGHNASVNSVAVTSDGRLALSGSADKTLKVWEIGTGRCLGTIEGNTNDVTSVALFGAGRFALFGSADNKIKLWRFIYDLEFD